MIFASLQIQRISQRDAHFPGLLASEDKSRNFLLFVDFLEWLDVDFVGAEEELHEPAAVTTDDAFDFADFSLFDPTWDNLKSEPCLKHCINKMQ